MEDPTERATATKITKIDVRGLVVRFVLALVAVVAIFVTVGALFHEEMVDASAWFVATLGRPGVVLGFLLPDFLSLPVPQDAFTAFGLAGGMSFWEVVGLATFGSLAGGSMAFAGGRYLSTTRFCFYERMVTRRNIDAEALLRRYGVTALGLGALTPLPYSIMCWAAGALSMKYRTFVVVSLLRLPRVAFWLYLIQLGLVTTA